MKSKAGGLEITADPSWEERTRSTSWDIADAYRQAIVNETQRCARLRYEAGVYIVEWQP